MIFYIFDLQLLRTKGTNKTGISAIIYRCCDYPIKIITIRTIFASLFLCISLSLHSQDSSKVEQYCEVVATGRLLSNKVTIDIDYGEERSFWKDHRLKDDEGNLKKFNSIIDALNYLGKTGWKLVNAFPISESNGPKVYHYIFKKEFLKSDTE